MPLSQLHQRLHIVRGTGMSGRVQPVRNTTAAIGELMVLVFEWIFEMEMHFININEMCVTKSWHSHLAKMSLSNQDARGDMFLCIICSFCWVSWGTPWRPDCRRCGVKNGSLWELRQVAPTHVWGSHHICD